MVFNCIDWPRETKEVKLHPTQKPVKLLERLIEIFTDEGDTVIDPVAGSGSTLIAASNLNRRAYSFEIKMNFYTDAKRWIQQNARIRKEIEDIGYAKTEISKTATVLF
jgi:site-specific DNA-methyltransferase (adenine-specific)